MARHGPGFGTKRPLVQIPATPTAKPAGHRVSGDPRFASPIVRPGAATVGCVQVYGTRIHVQGPLISKAEAPDRSTVQGPSKKFGMLGWPARLKTT